MTKDEQKQEMIKQWLKNKSVTKCPTRIVSGASFASPQRLKDVPESVQNVDGYKHKF